MLKRAGSRAERTEWKFAEIRSRKAGWWSGTASRMNRTHVRSNARRSISSRPFFPVPRRVRGRCAWCRIPIRCIASKANRAACPMACTTKWARSARTKSWWKLRTTTSGFRSSATKRSTACCSVWVSRIADLKKDLRLKYVSVFKNQGELAGEEWSHAHSEVTGTIFVPRRIKYELRAAREWFKEKERCVFCDIVRQEEKKGKRIVDVQGDYYALVPVRLTRAL